MFFFIILLFDDHPRNTTSQQVFHSSTLPQPSGKKKRTRKKNPTRVIPGCDLVFFFGVRVSGIRYTPRYRYTHTHTLDDLEEVHRWAPRHTHTHTHTHTHKKKPINQIERGSSIKKNHVESLQWRGRGWGRGWGWNGGVHPPPPPGPHPPGQRFRRKFYFFLKRDAKKKDFIS